MFTLTETGAASTSALDFVKEIFGAITANISLAQVAAILVAIIGAGIVSIFAWKFARKGYNFVKNALAGRSGRI